MKKSCLRVTYHFINIGTAFDPLALLAFVPATLNWNSPIWTTYIACSCPTLARTLRAHLGGAHRPAGRHFTSTPRPLDKNVEQLSRLCFMLEKAVVVSYMRLLVRVDGHRSLSAKYICAWVRLRGCMCVFVCLLTCPLPRAPHLEEEREMEEFEPVELVAPRLVRHAVPAPTTPKTTRRRPHNDDDPVTTGGRAAVGGAGIAVVSRVGRPLLRCLWAVLRDDQPAASCHCCVAHHCATPRDEPPSVPTFSIPPL